MRMHMGFSFRPKDIIKWIGLIAAAVAGFLSIGGIKSANAYVVMETTDGNKTVDQSFNIDFENGPFQDCSSQSCNVNSFSLPRTFLLSPSLYWYVGSQKGSNIGIVADFNIWLETPGIVAGVEPGYLSMGYFNSVYDTITAENLRCKVGDQFKTGYTSSAGGPQVSNFEKHINVGLNSANHKAYAIINVKFTYNQQIPNFDDSQTNMSCWFERDPSNGLFGDFIPNYYDSSKSTGILSMAYDMNNLVYMVSDHPLAGQLNEINANLNNVTEHIDELHQTITVVDHHVSDIDDTIKDSSIDLNQADSFFGDFDDDDHGLSGIITAPLVVIRSLNDGSTCDPLTFSVLGKQVSMPSGCILWDNVPSAVESIYFVFVGGLLGYILVTRLFHDINDLKDPNKSEVSTLDL